MLEEGSSLVADLTTTGRVTGSPHTIPLRLVYYQGRIYASRRDARSDWCRNTLRNPRVAVDIAGQRFTGIAALVTDCTIPVPFSGFTGMPTPPPNHFGLSWDTAAEEYGRLRLGLEPKNPARI